MSEYWVSHKKYFCRYCEIYITDDAPSRLQHENGLRHKGNKERFVRGLYKAGEKRKKDLEEEKREIERVEKAAHAAFAQDVGAGHAKASTSSTLAAASASPSTAVRKPPPKPSNPYANYTTAEFLGYTDPDIERMKAEAALRQTQGVAGEWQVVESTYQQSSRSSMQPQGDSPTQSSNDVQGDSSLKRAPPVDEEDTRQFKLRKRTIGVGLGEIYDPGLLPIKLKAKEEPAEVKSEPIETSKPSLASSNSQPTDLPRWTKMQWKSVGPKGEDRSPKYAPSPETSSAISEPLKQEDVTTLLIKEEGQSTLADLPSQEEEQKSSMESLASGAHNVMPPDTRSNLFRKRRAVAGAGSRRTG